VTGGRGRRSRKLLDDLMERRGYYHLKEEALDRTIWRARFGREFGPDVRQSAKQINECKTFSLVLRILYMLRVLINTVGVMKVKVTGSVEKIHN
jgi:hypothetical protein